MEQVFSEIDVSVIIVNYNCLDLLENCLNTLFEKTNNIKLQVIVVDNASTDGDVKNITDKYSSIETIVNEKNIGFAAANNEGLKKAKGKYTLFLNNDTAFTENTIKTVFDFTESQDQNVFVGVQLLNSDNTKQESIVEFPSIWNSITENFFLYKLFPKSKVFNKYYQNYHNHIEPIEVDVIRGAFMFCPTEKIIELNGFDERFYFYSEETDLCYRFRKSGGKIFFSPGTSIVHYGGAAADKDLWFKFKNQTTGKIQYYQKYFSDIRFTLILLIHFIGLLLRGILFLIGGILSINKNLFLKGYYFLKQIFIYPSNKF